MTTTYQLVPYLVSVNVRGKPKETRPLDNLFEGNERLCDELASMLASIRGELVTDGAKRPIVLRIDSVGHGSPRTLNLEAAAGRSGVVSRIRQHATGSEIQRSFNDVELMPVRHFLTHATGAHHAVLLAERVGGHGAMSALAAYLKAAWKARHDQTVLNIDAAVGQEAMHEVIRSRPISGLRFSLPTTGNGSLQVGAKVTDFVLEAKPVGRGSSWRLSDLIGKDRPAEEMSRGLLAKVTPMFKPGTKPEDMDKVAGQMLDDGWSVAATLRLPGGTQRTVNVDQKTALSMSFPIIEGEDAPSARPDDGDVEIAVQDIVKSGMLADWGVNSDAADGCRWETVQWTETEGWKAVWNVIVDQSGSSG